MKQFKIKYTGIFFIAFSLVFSSGVYSKEPGKKPEITVYKSPTCGCCKKWVAHLEKSGFNVKAINRRDMRSVKAQFGVHGAYRSCHTAKIGKYYIEGHVPASDIKRLIKEKPDAKGLAVPGMPMGSPGMEGHRKDRYSVLLVDKKEGVTEYSRH